MKSRECLKNCSFFINAQQPIVKIVQELNLLHDFAVVLFPVLSVVKNTICKTRMDFVYLCNVGERNLG